MLADKVAGDLAGVWLLVAEHLRLGTWDLLCGWTGLPTERAEPRLAMQLVHEAAVCTTGIRSGRTLHTRGGFELANGLPFVATDAAMHELLDARTVAQAQRLQVALGKLRHSLGHFRGKIVAIDPHRVPSYSRRRMRERVEKAGGKPAKMSQTFWLLDVDTHQPVCFTTASAATSVVVATPDLVDLASQIFVRPDEPILALADAEHFSSDLLLAVQNRPDWDLLVPLPNQPAFRSQYERIPDEAFQRHWAGYATTRGQYEFSFGKEGKYWQFVERFCERPDEWTYKGFMCTRKRNEVQALSEDYPKRWHVEEFFNANQELGWARSGTMNLNVRYGQMTMALIAQTVLHQFRQRLGAPYETWDADHMAKHVFFALQGDVRVTRDTIVVTYYNAPNVEQLRRHYENLPAKLEHERINPKVPWLYGYKLDFRFK